MKPKSKLKFNKNMFGDLPSDIVRDNLVDFFKDKTSGTSGNPLLQNYINVQSKPNEPAYRDYKKDKYGATDAMELTGNFYKNLTSKTSSDKKYYSANRKRKKYYWVGTSVVKKEDGKNVYTYAQQGRFKGIEGTKNKGKDKIFVEKKDYLNTTKLIGEAWDSLAPEEQGKNKRDRQFQKNKFRSQLYNKAYGFDKGSTKGIRSTQRYVTSNTQVTANSISKKEMQDVIEKILKESKYKVV